MHGLLLWLSRASGVATGEDDARYLLLSRALKQGTYRELWTPGQPPHHMYPPGFPALVAVWTAIGGERFDWLIGLQVVLSVATLVLMFSTVRRWMPAPVVLGALIVAAVSPDLLKWAEVVFSEPALTFCVALVVWAAIALPPSRRRTAIITLAAIAAPFLRAEGFVVPVAVIAELLWRRRIRAAVIASAAFAVIGGPLLWWMLNDPARVVGESYVADFTQKTQNAPFVVGIFKRVVTNALYYPDYALTRLLSVPIVSSSHLAVAVAAIIVAGCLTVGAAYSFRRAPLAVMILVVLSGLLLIWPYHVDRFLVPFLPVLILLYLFGLYSVGSLFDRRFAAGLVVAATAFTVVLHLPAEMADVSARLRCEPVPLFADPSCAPADARSFLKGVRFVVDSLPPHVRMLAAMPAPVFLHTGRQAVGTLTLRGLDSARFWQRLRQRGVDYVLLTHHPAEQVVTPILMTRCATGLHLLATFAPDAYLFRIVPERSPSSDSLVFAPQPPGDGPACAALKLYGRAGFAGH